MLNLQGCVKKLNNWFEENSLTTGISIIVLCIIEVSCLVFASICLDFLIYWNSYNSMNVFCLNSGCERSTSASSKCFSIRRLLDLTKWTWIKVANIPLCTKMLLKTSAVKEWFYTFFFNVCDWYNTIYISYILKKCLNIIMRNTLK